MATYFGVDYHEHFDANEYVNQLCKNVSFEEDCFQKFILESLHDIFKEGKIQGNCLLDIATGPNIYSVISASQWFNDIILSDYKVQCRDILKKWLNREEGTRNYETFFDFTGKLMNCSPSKLEEDVRSKVKAVLPCDVTQPSVLLESGPYPLYDAITCILCLDAAVESKAMFGQVLKHLAGLLRSGGHIIFSCPIDCTYYEIAGKRFSVVSPPKQEVYEFLAKAGFSDIAWYERPYTLDISDVQGFYVIKAQKQ